MHYYRLKSNNYPGIGIKVFQEKDIPIQVAIGNYDLGICGLDWIKELFAKLEKTYDDFLETRGKTIWQGEKAYEQYEGDFIRRAALLFDLANNEILITTDKFYDDVVLLEAIRRAVERGVKIRIIAAEMFPPMKEKLKKINIEMRLGRALPYLIIADEKHGMTVDDNEKGIWFLNCKTDYKDKFEDFWQKAHAI